MGLEISQEKGFCEIRFGLILYGICSHQQKVILSFEVRIHEWQKGEEEECSHNCETKQQSKLLSTKGKKTRVIQEG
ncbi:hypothetical protein C5167_003117 [Papaver somniferum]|uniref:Uncharacterized protein n=1 Tax=Papaver somniferum TaxID=3469 RepID=A0A4Y7L1S9_PAPSO|nr:hypothetical protein C5167_003117 [Papaver somniferum]